MTVDEKIKGSLYGFLIGDALGIPYKANLSEKLVRLQKIDILPPVKFNRSYKEIKPGTWSGNGAQMMCMLSSLAECKKFNVNNLANKLLSWYEKGYMSINQKVFDVGHQTEISLREYKNTRNPLTSGLVVKNGRGNASLSRALPLGLFGTITEDKIIEYSNIQSSITHADVAPQICCALYTMWIKKISSGLSIKDAYEKSVDCLDEIYKNNETYAYYFDKRLSPNDMNIHGKGTSYVLDSLRSVRDVVFKYDNYEDVVVNAVLLGNDTNSTAALAGGIAGLYYGYESIPESWLGTLKGKSIVEKTLKDFMD